MGQNLKALSSISNYPVWQQAPRIDWLRTHISTAQSLIWSRRSTRDSRLFSTSLSSDSTAFDIRSLFDLQFCGQQLVHKTCPPWLFEELHSKGRRWPAAYRWGDCAGIWTFARNKSQSLQSRARWSPLSSLGTSRTQDEMDRILSPPAWQFYESSCVRLWCN